MSKVLTLNFSNYMVVAAVLAVSALSGCVEYTSERNIQPQPKQQQENPAPVAQKEQDKRQAEVLAPVKSSCDILKDQYNEETAQAENVGQSITVERHYQRVVRKNCAGVVTSDQVETVKSPHYELDFKIAGTKPIRSVFVFNESSCDHKLTSMPVANLFLIGKLYAITGDGKNKIKIKGDLANALLTFKLDEGLNNIYVQYFYDCSPANISGNSTPIVGERNCQQSNDSLLVQYPVHVTYVTKDLEGIKEIPPSERECAAPVKKP